METLLNISSKFLRNCSWKISLGTFLAYCILLIFQIQININFSEIYYRTVILIFFSTDAITDIIKGWFERRIFLRVKVNSEICIETKLLVNKKIGSSFKRKLIKLIYSIILCIFLSLLLTVYYCKYTVLEIQ